jgi:hypothetical protein
MCGAVDDETPSPFLADLKVIESTHRVSEAPAPLREDYRGRRSRKYRQNRRALPE